MVAVVAVVAVVAMVAVDSANHTLAIMILYHVKIIGTSTDRSLIIICTLKFADFFVNSFGTS